MNVETAQIQVMQHLTMHKQLISGNTEDPVQAILNVLENKKGILMNAFSSYARTISS